MTASELMKAMADAGAPFDAILIAVAALDAKDSEIAARDAERSEKRARDAERKRASRASTTRPRKVRGRSRHCPKTPPIDNNHTPLVSSNDETSANPKIKKQPPAKPKCPEGVRQQVWVDFLDHRQRQKAPVSATAIDGIQREADAAGWTLDAALAECVSRGWRGFKADWVKPDDRRANNDSGDYLDQLLAKKARSP